MSDESRLANRAHPFFRMAVPPPLRGEQGGWEVRFQGRKGYAVEQGEFLWDGRVNPDFMDAPVVRRVSSGAVQGGDLLWDNDVYPTEEMALIAAEFKNDLVVALIVEQNEKLHARLAAISTQASPPCTSPFFLEGKCAYCGLPLISHGDVLKGKRDARSAD